MHYQGHTNLNVNLVAHTTVTYSSGCVDTMIYEYDLKIYRKLLFGVLELIHFLQRPEKVATSTEQWPDYFVSRQKELKSSKFKAEWYKKICSTHASTCLLSIHNFSQSFLHYQVGTLSPVQKGCYQHLWRAYCKGKLGEPVRSRKKGLHFMVKPYDHYVPLLCPNWSRG